LPVGVLGNDCRGGRRPVSLERSASTRWDFLSTRSRAGRGTNAPAASTHRFLDTMKSQASVPRDVFPPTPPGPEGSNGNGLFRVQWIAGV